MTSGTGSGRPGFAWGRKTLRFAVEGLKCCLGVKRKEYGRKAACFLLRGLSSPGPPNRAWASPCNPWNFSLV